MISNGIVLILAGIIMFIIALAQAMRNRSYDTCSENVTAIVTRKRRRNTGNRTALELTVTYMIAGIAYERIIGVGAADYKTISEGDQIELKYKTANPKKVVRPQDLNPRNVRIVLIIGTILTIIGIILVFIGQMQA